MKGYQPTGAGWSPDITPPNQGSGGKREQDVGRITVSLRADTRKAEDALDRVADKLREIIKLSEDAGQSLSRIVE